MDRFNDKIIEIKHKLTAWNGTVEVIKCCAEKYTREDIKAFAKELKSSGITGGRLQRIKKLKTTNDDNPNRR